MEEFVKVAERAEIPSGKMKKITVDRKDILVANVERMYCAIGNKCTHFGRDLSKGSLSGKIVKCPRHGTQYNIAPGDVQKGPASKPEPKFEVKIEGKNILLKKA